MGSRGLKLHKQTFVFILVIIAAIGFIWCIQLLKPPSEDFCTGEGYLPSNSPLESIHAIKVVIEPWLGEHQVYGIFQINSHKSPPGHPVILTVVGAGKYCETTNPISQHFQGIDAAPGYYLTKHYVRTRSVLWSGIHGLLNQLRQPQNWTLTYPT